MLEEAAPTLCWGALRKKCGWPLAAESCPWPRASKKMGDLVTQQWGNEFRQHSEDWEANPSLAKPHMDAAGEQLQPMRPRAEDPVYQSAQAAVINTIVWWL